MSLLKILQNHINSYFLFFKESERLFIILTHTVDDQLTPEVEFLSENVAAKRVPGTVENEYTISVTAPGKYLQEIMWLF